MNKSGDENRSVRNTKKKLRESLLRLMAQKPVNAITVRELTELADVNRGTFYFHYSDVHDMLEKIEEDFFVRFHAVLSSEDIQKDNQAHPYLQAIFSFLAENQDLCKILLSPNGDMIFMNRIHKLVDEQCSCFWRRAAPGSSPAQFERFNAFIIGGCVGVIQKWLDDGLQETPEEISEFIAAAVTASVKACIT